ncbi:MAG TPA: glycosyltransferase [Baekduia sp.]|nr:glycosyltransferase [Baekduia sp.]
MDAAAVGIVVATRDRRDGLLETLGRLLALPDAPPVVVVDNGSSDGTPEAVRAAFGDAVAVMALGENRGAAARTAGARALATPYVAFSDDDSWWAPGALSRAAAVLDAHPRLGLLAARVLVGPGERLDPTCAAMAASPIAAERPLPGPAVLGFVACGAVVRRDALLAAGGFDPRYGVGGEERRLAFDLAALGWELAYVPEVVAQHHPAAGPRPGRLRRQLRNDLWSAWLRRPAPSAARETGRLLRAAAGREPRTAVAALADAVAGTRWVLRERRVVPPPVERAVRALEAADRR